MSRGLAWLIAMLLIAGTLGWRFAHLPAAQPPLPVLYTLGGDFALPSTLGGTTRLSDFEGDLVLLNFGYTSCPEVCPTVLARMRDVMAMLPAGQPVRPLFVTLDPGADTIDRLAPYLRFFDPDFVGLTGTTEQIAATAADYKVYYERQNMVSTQGYSISHSAHIYLIDGLGRVRATFGEGVPVPDIARTVERLRNEPVAMTAATSGARRAG